jgi:hypothetical protein
MPNQPNFFKKGTKLGAGPKFGSIFGRNKNWLLTKN